MSEVLEQLRRELQTERAQNTQLANDKTILQEQLNMCKESLKSVRAIQQFRALIESLEYQFTALAPEFINQNILNQNPQDKFTSRVEKWKWILEFSPDPRAKKISHELRAFDAVDSFCEWISSLCIINCPKAIHLPGAKALAPHEVYEELVNNEIALDEWSKCAMRIILCDINDMPFPTADSLNTASSNSESMNI